MSSNDASLKFFTPSEAGLHYVKIDHRRPPSEARRCSWRTGAMLPPNLPWPSGALRRGASCTPTDTNGVYVPMEDGKSYKIDVRSVGYPSIDPWIIDIYDPRPATGSREPAGVIIQILHRTHRPAPPSSGRSYDGFFDHDSGPGNAARLIYTATKTGDNT